MGEGLDWMEIEEAKYEFEEEEEVDVGEDSLG